MPYVDSGGVPIYYDILGEGSPIVLHTGGGGDGTMWTQGGYIDGLQGFTRILIDHRGHGRSGRPTEPAAHHMEPYVADVLAVLNGLQIERAAFWGYSAGSRVGYALASTYPERIAGLIASGAIGPRDFDVPEEQVDAEHTATLVRQHGLGAIIKELEGAEGIVFPDWFMEQMTATDDEMYALEVLGAARWHGPWSLLTRIECPVLMLVGELEDPDGDNTRAASIMRDARCVTFPGLGHIGAYLRSDLALTHAVPFLRGLDQ